MYLTPPECDAAARSGCDTDGPHKRATLPIQWKLFFTFCMANGTQLMKIYLNMDEIHLKQPWREHRQHTDLFMN